MYSFMLSGSTGGVDFAFCFCFEATKQRKMVLVQYVHESFSRLCSSSWVTQQNFLIVELQLQHRRSLCIDVVFDGWKMDWVACSTR